MAKQSTFTAQRKRHQEFSRLVSEYTLTGGPVAQDDAAWQFMRDDLSVPEHIDQNGYAIDAPTMMHAGSVKSIGDFRDFAYILR